MIGQLKRLFARKLPDQVPVPSGETTLFNVYSTLVELERPTFAHLLHARRDLSDPELLAHLNRFCGHILDLGDGQMSADKYHVILHVQRVQHHLIMAVGVDDLAAFHAWAARANAILYTQDEQVTDPQGRVLLGATDPAAVLPYPAQALARKAATEAALAARGTAVQESLPPLISEPELVLRERDEVVGRARALLLVALRAESVASNEPMSVDTLLDRMPLAEDYLSPDEKAFLAKDKPTRKECAQFLWRYESLYVLEWALGPADALPFPAAPCDTAKTVATLIEMRGPALRTGSEILDALDLTYRLHWHLRQQRLKKRPDTPGVDVDVVMERHHALNWLVRFQHAGWDKVDTPT